jgi:hypothetical protein
MCLVTILYDFGNFCSHFDSRLDVISTSFLTLMPRPNKNKKIQMAAESRRGHLGHILDKGGTGRHLGAGMARRRPKSGFLGFLRLS